MKTLSKTDACDLKHRLRWIAYGVIAAVAGGVMLDRPASSFTGGQTSSLQKSAPAPMPTSGADELIREMLTHD